VDAQTLFEAAVRGAVTGLGSGLLAIALVVTFRTTRVLNFALGGIATIAAFTMSTLWGAGRVPLGPALIVVVALGAILGAAGELALQPLANATVVVKAVGALGLLLLAQAAVTLVWGPGERFLPLLVTSSLGSGGLRLAHQQLLAAGATLALGAAVVVWTRRTRTGTSTLAVAGPSKSSPSNAKPALEYLNSFNLHGRKNSPGVGIVSIAGHSYVRTR